MQEPADPAVPADAEEPSTGSLVVDRHRVRRPLGRLFWVTALLVPALLTAYVGLSRGPALEQELRREVEAVLAAADLADVDVRVDGRQVTALVPTGRDPVTTAHLVEAVPGVLAVSTREVYASAEEERACTDLQAKLDKATAGQRIPFAGSSAALGGSGRTMVASAAALLRACGAAEVVVGGHADSSARDAGALSLARARAVIAALVRAGVAEDRLEPRGYGDQFELDDGVGAASRAKNQRGSLMVKGA